MPSVTPNYRLAWILGLFLAPQMLSTAERPYVQPTFNSIVDKFESVYSVNIHNKFTDVFVKLQPLTIQLTNELVEPTVGECRFTAPRVININKAYWNAISGNINDKTILLFHELGHCVFDRQHREDLYPDHCPKSLMSAILMSEYCFIKHHNDLLVELPQG